MQNNALAEKKKVFWDGEEIPGLVSVAEVSREKSTIEVPSFNRVRKIQSGIIKLPDIEFVYRVDRGTETLDFMQNFYNDNEVKNCEIVRTDATGAEFKRTLYQNCESITIKEPAYDAANPEFAKVTFTIAMWEIIDL